MPHKIVAIIVFSVTAMLTGCTFYTNDIATRYPAPPPLTQAPPRILTAQATPNQIHAGRVTSVEVVVNYDDWNRDVGPDSIKVRVNFEKQDGNFIFTEKPLTITASTEVYGNSGQARFTVNDHRQRRWL